MWLIDVNPPTTSFLTKSRLEYRPLAETDLGIGFILWIFRWEKSRSNDVGRFIGIMMINQMAMERGIMNQQIWKQKKCNPFFRLQRHSQSDQIRSGESVPE